METINNYKLLDDREMSEVSGGFSITIMGVVFVGWKAWALASAGVTTLAGAAALGFYSGYNDTVDQKN